MIKRLFRLINFKISKKKALKLKILIHNKINIFHYLIGIVKLDFLHS